MGHSLAKAALIVTVNIGTGETPVLLHMRASPSRTSFERFTGLFHDIEGHLRTGEGLLVAGQISSADP